jgi:hypothetical protein
MEQPVYAWRVLRDGKPTALTVHLADDADAEVAALVIAAARRQGVELEPLYPPDLAAPYPPAA